MKRSIIAVTTVSLAAIASYALFAQTQSPEPGTMQGGMVHNGNVQMCPMCSMMADAMMHRAMVATEDLGVVVLLGNRLIRFDAELNVIRETEIPIDMEQMQQKIQQMMQNCPMHQQMMQRMQMGRGQSSAEPAPQARAYRGSQPQNP